MTKEAIKTFSYRISQASRSDLIVITYDIAVEYIEDAKKAYQAEDKDTFCTNVKYAKRVIDQLSSALDMQYEISGQLFLIYQYMSRVLVQSFAKKQYGELDAVIGMLKKLRASFYEVSQQDASGPLMENVQQVYAGFTYSNAGNSNEFAKDPNANRGFIV